MEPRMNRVRYITKINKYKKGKIVNSRLHQRRRLLRRISVASVTATQSLSVTATLSSLVAASSSWLCSGSSFSSMALLGLIKRVSRISRNNSRVRVYPARYFQSRDLSSSNTFHGKDAKLPVLIVGAGPVGLVLSILLTKPGTIYIEKSFLLCYSWVPVFDWIGFSSFMFRCEMCSCW